MRTFNLFPPQRICVEIGGRIKRLRLAHNLTQLQLAHMAGISLSTIRRLEAQGQGSLELVVRVAQALQAVDALEALFVSPLLTIAHIEREALLARRLRARVPKEPKQLK